MWLSISSACGTELGTGGELIPFPCQGTVENTALKSLMNGQPSMEAGDAAVKGKLEFAEGETVCKASLTLAWLCHLQTLGTHRIKRHRGTWSFQGLINT